MPVRSLQDIALDQVVESLVEERIKIPIGSVNIPMSNQIFNRVLRRRNLSLTLYNELAECLVTEAKFTSQFETIDVVFLNYTQKIESLSILVSHQLHAHQMFPLFLRYPRNLKHLDLTGIKENFFSRWIVLLARGTYCNLETLRITKQTLCLYDIVAISEQFKLLRTLEISNSTIPSLCGISRMTHLEELVLYKTTIYQDMDELMLLENLTSLDLSSIKLIVPRLLNLQGTLPKLEYIDVSLSPVSLRQVDQLCNKFPSIEKIGFLNCTDSDPNQRRPREKFMHLTSLKVSVNALEEYLILGKFEKMEKILEHMAYWLPRWNSRVLREHVAYDYTPILNNMVRLICDVNNDYGYHRDIHTRVLECLECFKSDYAADILDASSDEAILKMILNCWKIQRPDSLYKEYMKRHLSLLNYNHFFGNSHPLLDSLFQLVYQKCFSGEFMMLIDGIIQHFLMGGNWNEKTRAMIEEKRLPLINYFWAGFNSQYQIGNLTEATEHLRPLSELTATSVEACTHLLVKAEIVTLIGIMAETPGTTEIHLEILKILRNYAINFMNSDILEPFYQEENVKKILKTTMKNHITLVNVDCAYVTATLLVALFCSEKHLTNLHPNRKKVWKVANRNLRKRVTQFTVLSEISLRSHHRDYELFTKYPIENKTDGPLMWILATLRLGLTMGKNSWIPKLKFDIRQYLQKIIDNSKGEKITRLVEEVQMALEFYEARQKNVSLVVNLL